MALRLVKPATEAATVFTYVNRMGVRFYLHGGKTKTDKPRYFFARDVRAGALAEMPEGRRSSAEHGCHRSCRAGSAPTTGTATRDV